jgi:cyclopropane-fatty-acyl-phospholipid synthase
MNDAVIKDAGEVRWTKHLNVGAILLGKLVPNLACGALTVLMPNGRPMQMRGEGAGPEATLVLHRWRVLRRLFLDGDIGFAEAYMDGDWSSPDLTALVELAACNQARVPCARTGALMARLVNRLRHAARANTLSGSRRNIMHHYDLGNAFYAQWLDSGMTYSSALFSAQAQSLESAQTAKQDRVIAMLDLQPGSSVLEVGFGWGGLAERLASAGMRITGLTLSPAQLSYAAQRMQAAGLSDRADLRLQDYRQLDGSFDRIVSIEMLEAVGEAWWPTYFDTLRSRLRPGGTIVLQTITISDDRFAAYRREMDFIQRHIFPGGMLPSPSALRAEIARAGLEILDVEMFGTSYAQTLKLWQQRFHEAWPSIETLGFPPRFKRMWEYYLAYCEAGFRARAIDVGLWRLRMA